jgi:rhodanese-related sulfurtransferase
MPKTITNPQIRTIDKEHLISKMRRNESIEIVNVLSPDYYKLGFIKGSKKIPLDELDNRLQELDKNKEVITYCAGYECSASRKAAEKLANRGFRVWAYEGGIKEWKESGLPVE